MSNALIRVEGINLASVLDDTDDISVFRGASMLLRRAVKDLADNEITQKEWSNQLESISIGASIGLYLYRGDDPTRDCQCIADYLNLNKNYRHFTFTVAHEAMENTDDFRRAQETLLTRIRFHQQKNISLALPDQSNTRQVCEFDKLRPADGGETLKKRANSSASVRTRHEFGREQRKQFYLDELNLEEAQAKAQIPVLNFTTDLSELSESKIFGNLNDKMAVIYFDGNSFGKIQANCQSPEALQAWDNTIQDLRRDYLQGLINIAGQDQYFKNDAKLRLETLLWGGDELMLIVPAWRGMEVLQHFYQVSENWQYNSNSLRHAGGIVFCSRKTPIARIRTLSKALADRIKELAEQDSQYKTENYFDYLVLESIDYPTQSLNTYFEQYYQKIPGRKPLKAVPSWHALVDEHAAILEMIPHRQLHRLVNAATAGVGSAAYQQAQDRIKELMGDDNFAKAERVCERLFPEQSELWKWVHLLELWDYVAPKVITHETSEPEISTASA
ncbi:MAG: hypothetical protein KUG79_16000 [Pseudomonadales bacterium]|nr:hypothetical protein [Pseudomonadales bacterium]